MRRNALIGIAILTLSLIALMAFMFTPRKRTPTLDFADWMTVVGNFETGEWGIPVEPIPSTVIDNGVLKNVPYASWRAGDYEMNIYGDSVTPACIEIGVYGNSAKDAQAQQRCRTFMTSIVSSQNAKDIVQRLKAQGESIEAEGFTFEATPPGAPDAYGGWWISVYSTKALDAARASDAEMKVLAVTLPELPATDIATPSVVAAINTTTPAPPAVVATIATTPAPPAPQATISTNTPNPVRTTVTDSGWTPAQIAMAKPSSVEDSTVSNGSTSSHPTGSKTVYVSGYTRKNGTYVAPYMRSAPRK